MKNSLYFNFSTTQPTHWTGILYGEVMNTMSDAIHTFQRREKKFLLTASQYKTLTREFAPYFETDRYGKYTICNIYFDTDDDLLVRRSIEKPVYKEKLRLRSYGIPEEGSTLFLEIKKKYKQIVYKRRISLSFEQAERYLKTGELPQSGPQQQILRELRYFQEHYQPKPHVFLAYDRIALAGKEDSSLRVTFDSRIRCREDRLDPALGDDGKLLLPEDRYLMEIKVPGAYPLWMTRILSREKIYPVSFSKYGEFYIQKHTPHPADVPSNIIPFPQQVLPDLAGGDRA